jgi:hypothetical protein
LTKKETKKSSRKKSSTRKAYAGSIFRPAARLFKNDFTLYAQKFTGILLQLFLFPGLIDMRFLGGAGGRKEKGLAPEGSKEIRLFSACRNRTKTKLGWDFFLLVFTLPIWSMDIGLDFLVTFFIKKKSKKIYDGIFNAV